MKALAVLILILTLLGTVATAIESPGALAALGLFLLLFAWWMRR